jgi:integrase
MSVRKREWKTAKGEPREAWIVDYVDQQGVRRLKTFQRKKEADAWSDSTGVAVREGTHVADSASVTIKEAGELWIKAAEATGLERTTLDQYRQHLDLHIVGTRAPEDEAHIFIGKLKLSQLNAPTVRAFEDRLQESGRSPAMRRYVIRSLGSLLADAQERGLVVRNAVRDLRGKRRKGKDKANERRSKRKLKVGVDIPTPAEIRSLLTALKKSDLKWRAFFLTAIFTGLRASELRGLPWDAVDLKKGELHVRQRADRFNAIGAPKSEAGERTIPFGPEVAQALREWKLQCPKKGNLGLVFPNGEGNVEFHVNIIERALKPLMVAAGVTVGERDQVKAKYTGLHSLRHFYASWLINAKEDGGLGKLPKAVQELMGHSSIVVTMDTYGHLFPRGDDGGAMAEAERALLG